MDNPEHRRELRFGLACPVLVQGPTGLCYCVARNISSGGIFLETDQGYTLGSTLRITFELPDGGTTFLATGEVKHIVNFSYGAQGEQRALRGVGVKFLHFESGEVAPHLRCAPL